MRVMDSETILYIVDEDGEAQRQSTADPSQTQSGWPPAATTGLASDDPAQIGAYRIVRRIGAGAMATVYEARHARLGLRAAIKVLNKSLLQQPKLVQRFMGEAIAAARIRHPGVCGVYDSGHLPDGTFYLVMEYLDGQTLSERIRQGALPASEAIEIARQVAVILAQVHKSGVVHRDLKPDNIFLVRDGEGALQVKVFDFGCARFMVERTEIVSQTTTGRILGTPTHMAPEQCRASAEVDHRSDIYALG